MTDKIKVPRETLEAFRKTEPLFTEYLIQTDQVIVAQSMRAGISGDQHGEPALS